jgi:hypothetical protein
MDERPGVNGTPLEHLAASVDCLCRSMLNLCQVVSEIESRGAGAYVQAPRVITFEEGEGPEEE